MRKKKNIHLSGLRAKLTFDEGFAERPVYSIKAVTTEKDKGINMMELIENTFNISDFDREDSKRRKVEEFENINQHQIRWTRDAKGEIISPFRSDRKVFEPKISSKGK